MAEELILLERAPDNHHIAILTLNRPQAANAFDTPMLEELSAKLDQIDQDTSIRVVIMRSAGKHSSVGADLNELVVKTDDGYTQMTKEHAIKHIDDGRVVVSKLFSLRPPTIGLIHGFCLGGGAEFYTLCDVLYGASGGKEEGGMLYGFPETTIGVMAGWMGPEMLIRRIGPGAAKDILYTGRMVGAEEAFRLGIVQKLCPADQLLEQALKWARAVAANAPFAVESTRRTLNAVDFPQFEKVLGSTGAETVDNLLTDDFVKGAVKILTRSKEQPDYERQ